MIKALDFADKKLNTQDIISFWSELQVYFCVWFETNFVPLIQISNFRIQLFQMKTYSAKWSQKANVPFYSVNILFWQNYVCFWPFVF